MWVKGLLLFLNLEHVSEILVLDLPRPSLGSGLPDGVQYVWLGRVCIQCIYLRRAPR